MTGFNSKRQMVADKLQEPVPNVGCVNHDCDKCKAQPAQERNFCPRCGKRTLDLTAIHTCTPPQGAA